MNNKIKIIIIIKEHKLQESKRKTSKEIIPILKVVLMILQRVYHNYPQQLEIQIKRKCSQIVPEINP